MVTIEPGSTSVATEPLIVVPSPTLRDSDGIFEATRDKTAHDLAIGAEPLESQERLRDQRREPCAPTIGQDGQARAPKPSSPNRYHPSKDLSGFENFAWSRRRVAFRDDPWPSLRCVERDHTVTDQLAAVVVKEKIPNLKLRRGGGLHHELLPFAQRGVHAPTGHSKTERLAVDEEVADFQEICQAELVAGNRLGQF